MNIVFKSQLNYVKEKIRQHVAPYPWLNDLIFGRRGKIVFLSFAALAIIWVGNGQFYSPVSDKLHRIQKRLEQTTKKIGDLKKEFPEVSKEQKLLEEKDKSIENIRKRLRKEELRLPTRDNLDQVLAQFTTAEEGTSVNIVSVRPVEDSKKKPTDKTGKKGEEVTFYPTETFEIQLVSRFWDLIGYLSRLEQVSPYFSFPLLAIDAEKSKSAYPNVKLRVAMLINEGTPFAQKPGLIFKEDIEAFTHTADKKDPFGTEARLKDAQEEESPYKLSGIIWQGGKKVAIINNEVVREGDQLDRATIVSIGDNKVVVKENGFKHELTLAT